jgi:bifunctional DNA-binding transcriptional regulator/antitoxin component of YhaV-PrlF toxin-antitoxin module
MILSQVIQARVGKKYALYLPKAIVRALSIKEGGKVLLKVAGRSVILETLQDPLELALHEKKYASITPEHLE